MQTGSTSSACVEGRRQSGPPDTGLREIAASNKKRELMADPTPLLSTVAASSAGMVAIIGGLLVARFVAISSEQEGAQTLLDDGNDRLSTAQKRADEAHRILLNWDATDFFKTEVLQEIAGGTTNIYELQEIGGPCRLTNDELTVFVAEISAEFELAHKTLQSLINSEAASDYFRWADFKRDHSLPPTNWDEVWELSFMDVLTPPGVHRAFVKGGPTIPMLPAIPEYIALSEQRRDKLRGDLERAQQQVEDIASEVARLKRNRDAIVRPKGLGGGLIVLSIFTLVGVIIPIWLMSRGPKRLTAHLGEAVFWLFFTGLLALLGYMSVLALRLSGWWRAHSSDTS